MLASAFRPLVRTTRTVPISTVLRSITAKKMATSSAPLQEWLVIVPDHDGALQKRIAVRPEHLGGLKKDPESFWLWGGMCTFPILRTVAHYLHVWGWRWFVFVTHKCRCDA